MSLKTCFRRSVLTALLATTALVAPAWAQEAASPAATAQTDSDQGGVEEIVVTAQRRSERLQEVPIAVTPITAESLQTAGVLSSLELPRLATGMTTSPTTANAFFIPYIRGVGSNSPATGNDSSIALYIDGVYQSDKSANVLDFNDISRIEVLKGPQGTLFGRNATGGAINIVTLQPQGEFAANAEAAYQRFDRWTARGYITGPLSDQLSASLAFQHIEGGDYATNTGAVPGDFGGIRSDSLDFKVRLQPNSRFDATLALMYVDRSTTDMNSNLNPVPGTLPVGVLLGGVADFDMYEYAGSPNYYRTEAYRATLTARYSFDAVDLVSITGYVHTLDETDLDFDGTSADVLYFRELQGTNDWSQELQLLSNDAGPVQWVLGAYYFDGTAQVRPLNLNQGAPYSATIEDDPSTYPGGTITHINARGPTTAEAIYGQATYAITDNTNLTGGLRYTRESREYDFTVSGIGQIAPLFYSPTLIPLASDDGQRHETFDKVTWRLAVDHHFTPDIMGYVSWNRGFKSGTFNLNDFTPNQEAVNPEVLDAYEVGLKTQFFDHQLQFNTAIFYYDYQDIQIDTIVASGSGPAATVLQNAASERIQGVDVDLIYQPTPDLQFRASGTWLDAEYGTFLNATAFLPDPVTGNGVQTAVDASGTRGMFAPEWSYTLGADYTLHFNGGGSMLFSGTYFRTADYKVGIGPEDRVNEYDSLGLSVTYTLPGDHYYIRGYGSNLTDQQDIGTSLSALKASRQEIPPAVYGVAIGMHF